MPNFEKKLLQITKPEVTQIKHESLLTDAISNAKGLSAVSLWWLSLPLYIISIQLMKTFFMPGTTLISNINELTKKEQYFSLLFFLVMPVIFIIINFFSIHKIYFLSGSPKKIIFLQSLWYNVLIIIFSFLVSIIYLL